MSCIWLNGIMHPTLSQTEDQCCDHTYAVDLLQHLWIFSCACAWNNFEVIKSYPRNRPWRPIGL
jgi:hypothetical protein